MDGRAEVEILTNDVELDDVVLLGMVEKLNGSGNEVALNGAGDEVTVELNGADDDELRNEADVVVVVEMESREGQSYRWQGFLGDRSKTSHVGG